MLLLCQNIKLHVRPKNDKKINIVKKINQSILLLSYTECKCYWKCAVLNFIDYRHAGFTFSKSVPQVIRINNIVFYCQSCSTNPILIRMDLWNDVCVCPGAIT